MKHILNTKAHKEIHSKIKDAEHVLLVLDYDGTLTPIVENPERAELDESTKSQLQSLAQTPYFTIGIISGRSLFDIKKRVALENICYAGNYGLEIEMPSTKFTASKAKELRPAMLLIEKNLLEKMKHIEGLSIEGKDLALSVHYRHINKEKLKQVKETLYNTCGTLLNKGLIKVVEGKKAWEVLPLLPLDKSKAFLWMLKNLSFSYKRILPIYVGDDTTDESAFEAANKKRGISIFVGTSHKASCAHYYLNSPSELKSFLEQIGT